MANSYVDLRGFARRVRLLYAWRGAAVGVFVGSVGCVAWTVLDWMGSAYTEWSWLGATLGGCAVLGAVIGATRRLKLDQIAASVDRRGGLSDRVRSSLEVDGTGSFDAALNQDAQTNLASLRPGKLYPLRLGRWHLAAVVMGTLASGIFLLGNTPLFLTDQAKHDREDVKNAAKTVEHVVRPMEAEGKKPDSAEEQALAKEIRKFQQELQKARIQKPEAMQKANDLAKKADELTKNHEKLAEQSLAKAETALQKMEKAQLDKSNPNGKDMQAELAKAQEQGSEIQKKLDELNKELSKSNLSKEERANLEAQKSALEKEQEENAALQMELSKSVRDMIDRMMKNPLYAKLQELAKKLAESAKAGEQSGQPKLTKEELEQMKKDLEELAKQLKDDAAMKEYMEALLKAMEEAEKGDLDAGVGLGMLAAFGLPIPGGVGAATQDIYHGDNGHINKLDKPVPGQGKTSVTAIKGSRQDKGEETYIEVRGPASLGARSRVPFTQVLPSYRRKAEQAIDRKDIPPDQQKRVKQYFDSLQGH